MKAIYSTLRGAAAMATVVVSLCGLALAQAQPTAQPAGAPGAYAGGDQESAGPAGATRPLEVPLLYVTGIEVTQESLEPKVMLVRVTGLASSEGWSGPQLVPFYYGKPLDDTLDLQFVGTSPEQSQKAEGFVPISAIFTVDAGLPFKAVRVRAAANALEVKQIPGSQKAEIKADGCKECIGKKYAEKGKAPAGASKVVREEDLPRGFRVIAPTHGVAGIVHNPNRLDLILDANNTIVMAFWE
ncbi:MAG: hypothetical protein ACHQC9_01660 [Alphaproteobacteria bacterium]